MVALGGRQRASYGLRRQAGAVRARGQCQRLGVQREAVAAGGAHHPFEHRHQPQPTRPLALRQQAADLPDLHLHLFDRGLRVQAPGERHFQLVQALAHAGEADAVGDLAHAAGRQAAPQRPDAAALGVVQQQPFAGRVAQRVIGPGCDLVQPAVAGPGVAARRLGHLAAHVGVGQHIHPRPGRQLPGLDLEAEGRALVDEAAGGQPVGYSGDRGGCGRACCTGCTG